MLKFSLTPMLFKKFERLCGLPAKTIPKLEKLFQNPGIFDSFDLEYDDYVGISHQVTATERDYDVI